MKKSEVSNLRGLQWLGHVSSSTVMVMTQQRQLQQQQQLERATTAGHVSFTQPIQPSSSIPTNKRVNDAGLLPISLLASQSQHRPLLGVEPQQTHTTALTIRLECSLVKVFRENL